MQRIAVMMRWRADRRGAAAVELALVMPVLFTVFFGILKFGIALNHRLILTDAVRVATRQLAVGRSSATVYDDTISRFNSAFGAGGSATVALSINGTTCNSNATCQTLLATANGLPATATGQVNCDLSVMGYDFAPSCKLTAQTSERVE